MPVYEIKGPDGRVYEVQGARPPTADEIRQIVASQVKTARPEDFAPEVSGPDGSAVGRFLSNAGEMLNPVTAVKGIASAIADPMAALSGIYEASAGQYGKAREAVGRGDYLQAVGHAGGMVPLIGPAAAEAGEQIASGDISGGLGKGAGLVLGAGVAGPATRMVGRTVRPAAKRAGESLYQSALKPTKSVLKDVRTPSGAGPDAARQALVKTGLEEGIAVSPSGARKAGNLIDSLNGEVQQRLSSAQSSGRMVDPTAVEQIIKDVAKDFTDQVNAQPDVSAVQAVRQNFMTNPNVSRVVDGPAGPARVTTDIPVETAQRMKVKTYRGLRGKYGVERGATIEAEKAGARGLREGIEKAAPEVADLNAREGSLIPLEEAIADAMRRRGNYGIFGLTPVVAAVPAIAHGNAWPLLAAMVDRMPGVVSRSGIWINRVGQRKGRITQEAARTAAAGNVTSPSESRRRTRGLVPVTP